MRKVVDFQKPQIEPPDLRSFSQAERAISAPNLSKTPTTGVIGLRRCVSTT